MKLPTYAEWKIVYCESHLNREMESNHQTAIVEGRTRDDALVQFGRLKISGQHPWIVSATRVEEEEATATKLEEGSAKSPCFTCWNRMEDCTCDEEKEEEDPYACICPYPGCRTHPAGSRDNY